VCAEEFVNGGDFIMYLGDNILKQSINELVERYGEGRYAAGIALKRVSSPERFGIADVDENGKVIQLIKKRDNPPINLALIGVYVFSPKIFDTVRQITPSWRGELGITDGVQTLIKQGDEIDSHIIEGWWKDTGKPEDILEANRLVLEDIHAEQAGIASPGAETAGQTDLHESATIESGAVV